MIFIICWRETNDSDNDRNVVQQTQVQPSATPLHSTLTDPNIQPADQNVSAPPAASTSSDKSETSVPKDDKKILQAGVKRKYKKATKHEYKMYSDR